MIQYETHIILGIILSSLILQVFMLTVINLNEHIKISTKIIILSISVSSLICSIYLVRIILILHQRREEQNADCNHDKDIESG